MKEKITNLRTDHALKKETDIGPVVDQRQLERDLSYIKIGKSEGASLFCGGERVARETEGNFLTPALFIDTHNNMRINQEEIFGPVVTMIPFTTEEEVIKMANSTKYGLSASIFTENVSKAHRVAANIDSGVVWINTWLLRDLRIPFGGMKSSGMGREGAVSYTHLTLPTSDLV